MTGLKYAGIGSRNTPKDICGKMFTAGRAMADLGFILRSGGAKGADTAFEQGAMASASYDEANPVLTEIFLPYQRFNGHSSPLFGTTKAARQIAKQYHPRWEILGDHAKDFMGRNAYQILGRDLDDPVSFVICWTPKGAISGGTGQALRHATDLGIPILNFATDEDDYISDFILNLRKE